ncbi:MAG: AAA domain-containing protein [Bacteroidales bacterium]
MLSKHSKEFKINVEEYSAECLRLIDWIKIAKEDDGFGSARLKFLFEQILFDLTHKERRVFSGIYARIIFLADMYNWPVLEVDNLQALRFYLSFQNLKNIQEANQYFLSALKSFVLFLEFLFPETSFHLIQNELKTVNPLKNKKTVTKEKTDSLLFRVLKISEESFGFLIEAENLVEGNIFTIALKDIITDTSTTIDEKGQVKLGISGKQSLGRRFTFFASLLDQGSVVHAMNLTSENYSDYNYSVGNETVFVLEPDYLVDSSDLAECFQSKEVNPYFYFLRLLLPHQINKPIVKGNIVNNALDSLFVDQTISCKDIVEESLKDQLIILIKFGEGLYEEVSSEILEYHWKNLHSFVKENESNKVRIEPSFYSSRYGIQGRLDVMLEYAEDHYRKDIIELKSGKAPLSLAWMNNQYQVIAYQLLLSSCFDYKRKGSSSIFYSRATENPIRDIPSFIGNVQNLMMARNLILKVIRMIEEGKFLFSSLPQRVLKYQVPAFAKQSVNEFKAFFQNLDSLRLNYYQVYITFLFRELITARTGSIANISNIGAPFSLLWNESFSAKRDRFGILYSLKADSYQKEKGAVIFCRNEKMISAFRKGDMVLLYAYQHENDNPINKEIFKGNILSVSEEKVVVSLRNKQVDDSVFSKNCFWAMEKDFYEKNLRSGFHSLYRFCNSSLRRRQNLIFGIEEPSKKEKQETYFVEGLMFQQQKVLNKIINAEDYFLLQGPPGTGKTSAILLNLVKYFIEESSMSILLLAFTNKAIDQICEKLERANLPFVRLNQSIDHPEWNLKNKINAKSYKESMSYVKRTKIFVSTLASWQNKGQEVLEYKKFDVLIVDEASQLTEPDLAGILVDFPKWILIGDQNQLPAVVTQSEELCIVDNQELSRIGVKDLRVSLFERLILNAYNKGWSQAYDQLTDHFRMHQEIADSINHWYSGNLRASLACQQIEVEWEPNYQKFGFLSIVISSGRLVYWNSESSGVHKAHPNEACQIVSLIDVLFDIYKDEFSCDTVGVITPFRAQIAEIKQRMESKPYKDFVVVDTVERFQGGECDHILFSAAITNPIQIRSIQCLNEDGQIDRKLNVALSRAKKQFVMIGHENTLSKSSHYKAYIDLCRRKNSYFKVI